MAETWTRKDRVQAGVAGFTTAFVAWPVLAVAVLLLVAAFGTGWQMFGLLAIGAYGWIVLSLTAAVIGAFVGGPPNQVAGGVLKIVSVAIGLYLLFALVMITV